MGHSALAKRLGIRRENIYHMHRRYPELQTWISGIVAAGHGKLVEPVIARMGVIAMKGSADHARVFLTASGRMTGDTPPGTVIVNINGVPDRVGMTAWPGGVLEAPKG